MELIKAVTASLNDMKVLLNRLELPAYTASCSLLDGASIGKHIRHIIELYTCLIKQYSSGTVNYDIRERDITIENSQDRAISEIDFIIQSLDKPDRELKLQVQTGIGSDILVNTNFYRELVYNFEHCIHHQALIKVALCELGISISDSHFGYAPSTIRYLNQESKK